jgi:flagella basal body P-ring formation protein FlgA
MKSFSLVDKLPISIGWVLAAIITVPAHSGEVISGAHLKDYVHSVLLARGLDSIPVISDSRQFRACNTALEVSPMFGGYKTISLSCPDDDGFKIAVRTQINKNIDDKWTSISGDFSGNNLSKFVVLTKSVKRGEVITADDVMIVRRPGSPGVSYYSNLNDVVGRKAKRSLSINKTIRTRHLELDWTIQKDQSVIIESKIGSVTVASAGTAIANAQIGELVKVRNHSSELVVEGVVVSEKKIRIRAK